MAARVAGRPGEFELIDRYFRPLATDSGALKLADDAAVLKSSAKDELVVTTDLVAAGVHFFADDPAASIARKALRVNLSDLAAKGAEPFGYLLAMALPEDWTEDWIKGFAKGLRSDQAAYRLALFGGDTSRAAGGLTIAITAFGRLPRGSMVHRSGARPGDLLYVSGTIGDGALGLILRLGRVAAGRGRRHLIDRYLHPQPRTALAPAIRRHATSAMDVSDGLVGDFAHICEASGVSGEIEAERVPLSGAARATIAADPAALVVALTGGDDYEILATIGPKSAPAFERDAARASVPVTRIGRITKGKGAPVVIGSDGEPVHLGRPSFDHFGAR
jgi:thiamine-monophosphate kinase